MTVLANGCPQCGGPPLTAGYAHRADCPTLTLAPLSGPVTFGTWAVPLPPAVVCPLCGGSGSRDHFGRAARPLPLDSSFVPCHGCDGRGWVR